MNAEDQTIADLLQQADRQCPAVAIAPPNARQLAQRAAWRQRRRVVNKTAAVVLLAVVTAGAVYRLAPGDAVAPPPVANADPAAATGSIDVGHLVAEIDELSQQVAEIASRVEGADTPAPDILSVLQSQQTSSGGDLEQLRAELAAIDSRAAASDADLVWNIEWARSGALRLELARLNKQLDPAAAENEYRQIAATYSGTRWGDQARLALTGAAQQ